MIWLLLSSMTWAQQVPEPPMRDVEAQAFLRGRRTSVAGLFLGWAGAGLAVGGAALTVSGRGVEPLQDRELLVWTVTAGGGVAMAGLVLQGAGSLAQRRALAPLPRQPLLRGLGLGAAAVGAVGTGVVIWRLHIDEPGGNWLLIGAPVAALGTVASIGLHTVALLQSDAIVEEAAPQIRFTVGPTYIGLNGRF